MDISMKPSIKATLLSALVFPGLGQIILKRYYRAAILFSVSLIALYILITSIIEKATAISEKIISGQIAPNTEAIAKMISESSAGYDASITNTATSALIIVWLFAIIDAFFIRSKNTD